jgi:hypothetical protein
MAGWANGAKEALFLGTVLWLTDTIAVLLVGPNYTFSANHRFVSDVVAHEVGTRKTLGGKTVARNEGANRAELDASDILYTSLNVGTVKGLWVFKNTGADATSLLLFYVDGGFPVGASGVNLTVQWAATGIAHLAGE